MDRQQQKVLKEHGIVWEELTKGIARQAKATYYSRDGEPMPNLPADPKSLERYLARGFTLTPPENPVAMPVAKETILPTVKEEILPQNESETRSKVLKTKRHKRSHNKSK